MIKLIIKCIKDSIRAILLHEKQISDISKILLELKADCKILDDMSFYERKQIETEFFKQRWYKIK